jgi:hypothetical protein
MNWKEEIDKYKEDIMKSKEAAQNNRLEAERQTFNENSPELLAVLEQLEVEKTLASIRDDLWKLGEVHTSVEFVDGGISRNKYDLVAKSVLKAEWPVFRAGYSISHPDHPDDGNYVPPDIEVNREELSVIAGYDFRLNEILIRVRSNKFPYHTDSWFPPVKARDPQSKDKLKINLIKESIERQDRRHPQLPYDLAREKAEQEIINMILRNGFVPDEKFKYFLDMAKSRR